MVKSIAVITARGGSKRIPKKNIKDFCGKPIIAYSIEAALKSKVFDTVMVSTDDEEIAKVARQYGAEVPFMRSEKTADDFATTNDVLLEVLDEYASRNVRYDILCCIYPTAPFVTDKKLKECMEIITKSQADTLIPVVSFSYPIQRSMFIEDNMLKVSNPQYLDTRSQDLKKFYHDVGQFYFTKVKNYMVNKKLMSGKIIPYIIPEIEVQDIDNEMDWKLAEVKYRYLKKEQ